MNYRYGLIVMMVALPLILASQLPTYTVSSARVSATLAPGDLKALGGLGFNYNTSEAVIEANATQVSGGFELMIFNGSSLLLIGPPSNFSGFVYNSTLPSAASRPASYNGISTITVESLANLRPIIKQQLSGGKVSYVKVTPSYKLSSMWVVVNSTDASGKLTAVMTTQTLPVPSYYLSAGLSLLLIGLILFVMGLLTSHRR